MSKKENELSEFIQITIESVLEGIANSKSSSTEKYNNCIVAPGGVNEIKDTSQQHIEFEIWTETSTNGEGNLQISVVKIGGDISKTNHHKIKFSVPLFLRGLGYRK